MKINPRRIKITAISKALSKITQMKGVSGNEAIINRMSIITDDGNKELPCLSSNALRHKIREKGMYHLIKLCSWENGALNYDQLFFMNNGGILSESSINTNLKTIADMKNLLPLYRVLGGSLRNQIIEGEIKVGYGYLICNESLSLLKSLLPLPLREQLPKQLKSMDDFVTSYQYTRGDVRNHKDIDWFSALEDLSNVSEKSNLMLTVGENVKPNSLFYHFYNFDFATELELGAFFSAFREWQLDGGLIGGKSSIGHGNLETKLFISDSTIDIKSCIDTYEKHVLENKENALKWLNENFNMEREIKAKLEKKEKEETKKKEKEEKVKAKEKPKTDLFQEALLDG